MDVYDVNEDLVKTLVNLGKIETVSKEFSGIVSNHAKVNYVEKLLVKYEQFSKLDLKLHARVDKSDEKAKIYRKEGNECFSLKNKNYYKALELYNKSICYSEKDSENLSIGYANRSAILFEWERYKECLDNIKLARESNYPQRLSHKLERRERQCIELMRSIVDEKPHYFKLTYNCHLSVPFIIDSLDMKTNDEFGRYIYTKRDLHAGDLVAIEEPYCSILLPSQRYSRCANCKRENFLTLIPCQNCTSTMFCSQLCLNEALESFHIIECPIIDLLFDLFSKIHLIALRVTLTTMNLFSNIDECIDFCTNEENSKQNSFTLNYENFSKKEHYRAIHGLVTNQEKRIITDLFQRAIIAATLRRYILENTPLKEVLNNEVRVNFFTDLLFHHLQTSSSNMHSVDLIDSKALKGEHSFASAAYAFGSLINHSCAPNIVRIYNGMTLLIFIIRPVPSNGILYDNYGYHYATHQKRTRLQNLETQYRFICKCEACENDYPLYNQLPIPIEIPDGIDDAHICKLMAYDKNFALEILHTYCVYLNNFTKYFPCKQICSVEESLKMVLNILVDAVPVKLKY